MKNSGLLRSGGRGYSADLNYPDKTKKKLEFSNAFFFQIGLRLDKK